MSTSGGGIVNALLYVIELMLAMQLAVVLVGAGSLETAVRGIGLRSIIVGAAPLWLLVAVPSLLQIPFPVLFRALRRDPGLIRHHGQVWRVFTSLVVQDVGLAATIAGLALTRVRGAKPHDWVLLGRALGVVLIGVVLMVLGDAHGIPMIGGVVLGALSARAARNRAGLASGT